MSQPKAKNQNVTYVRIGQMYHPWLQWRYGSLPVDAPVTSAIAQIISTNISPNPTMRKICYSTFSEQAYNHQPGQQQPSLFDPKIFTPTAEDRLKLVGFVMPDTVIYGDRRIDVNASWQLSNRGYDKLKKQIISEFWNSFVQFDTDFAMFCTVDKTEKYTIDYSLEEFMRHTGVDMDYHDTLVRYWSNIRRKNRDLYSRYNSRESMDKFRRRMQERLGHNKP